MEIKNNMRPMFHMLVKDDDGNKKGQMSYDLTEQSYESIKEMGNVFAAVNKYFPNITMWFTLGSLQYDETGKNRFTGETPVEENTENKL